MSGKKKISDADEEQAKQVRMMAVTPSELISVIDRRTSRVNSKGFLKNMIALFIWGAPGIGKTQIVGQIARKRRSRLVALYLPQFDPTDLKGIPVRMDDGTIKWMPTSYLPQESNHFVSNIKDDDGNCALDIEFQYAIDVAIYVYDRDDQLLGRYNDPSLPDMGDVTFDVSNEGIQWTVDVKGLPEDAYRIVVEDKAILFLDELSSADPSTQTAALQLVLDRRVGEYDVPSCVPVLAAGNREEDGAFVQTLSHPLCNRFSHITLRPDADDWIEWAVLMNIRPEIIGLIKWDPDALFDYDPDTLTNGQYGFASPRTWEFLSDQYEDIEYYDSIARKRPHAERLRLIDFSGIVGSRRATQLIGYIQVMHDMPSPEDIIAGRATDIGDVERSKSFGLLYALISNLEHYYKVHYDTTKAPDDQSETWIQARDNILDFITNNFSGDSVSWAVTMLFQKSNIEIPSLRSPAFLRLSQDHVSVITQVGRAGRK